MPDVSVDNDPITVVLEGLESFTPRAGVTVVCKIQTGTGGKVTIEKAAKEAISVADSAQTDTASEISVVLTDQTTVKETADQHAYISGFVV